MNTPPLTLALNEIDAASPEDIRSQKSETLETVYNHYVLVTYVDVDTPCTPESFVEFWESLTRSEKINFFVDSL